MHDLNKLTFVFAAKGKEKKASREAANKYVPIEIGMYRVEALPRLQNRDSILNPETGNRGFPCPL